MQPFSLPGLCAGSYVDSIRRSSPQPAARVRSKEIRPASCTLVLELLNEWMLGLWILNEGPSGQRVVGIPDIFVAIQGHRAASVLQQPILLGNGAPSGLVQMTQPGPGASPQTAFAIKSDALNELLARRH